MQALDWITMWVFALIAFLVLMVVVLWVMEERNRRVHAYRIEMIEAVFSGGLGSDWREKDRLYNAAISYDAMLWQFWRRWPPVEDFRSHAQAAQSGWMISGGMTYLVWPPHAARE